MTSICAFTILHASVAIFGSRTSIKGTSDRTRIAKTPISTETTINPLDKNEVMKFIHEGGWIMDQISPSLQADKDVVMAAVTHNPKAIRYASPALKQDADVVLQTMKQKGCGQEIKNNPLMNDTEFVLAAIRINK